MTSYMPFDTAGMDRIRPAWLEVDLDCLAWNMRQVKAAAGAGVRICASVKSNAYGHGCAAVAGVLLENGADRLSVAILDEALELRRLGIVAPVLILGALEYARARDVAVHGFAQTISSIDEARALSEASKAPGTRAAVHIKIDTGMGRLGFQYDDPDIYEKILASCALPGLYAEGIFTHFAASDEADAAFTHLQLRRFTRACEVLSGMGRTFAIRHCSNSAAISGFPEASLDMVRPGIALYGGAGGPEGPHHADMRLRRVLSLRATITLVKRVKAGDPVGYGRRFIAQRDAIIATIPIGYADGYSRGLSCGKGAALINGRRAPIAGTVCMDQCMADVTDAGRVNAGDEAVLYGRQGGGEITLEEVSRTLDTIPYELMCAISRRVPRVYIKNGKPAGAVNYLVP